MRLRSISALTLLALTSSVAAQQATEPCGCDWRKLFERDLDVLVQPPEFSATPASGGLFEFVPRLDAAPDFRSVSVVRFTVDTLGTTSGVEVVCAPSVEASLRVAALVESATFSPARQRGRPVRQPLMLPVAFVPETE